MRRRPLPFDLRAPAAAHELPNDMATPEGSVLAGTPSGMPRFLASAMEAAPEMAPAPDSEPASDDVEVEVETVPDISGVGVDSEAAAHSLTLDGLTEATFSSSFSTQNVRTQPATDCDGCSGDECVRVTGTVVSTFHVTTQVTLPSVNDFPELTACQRQRVRAAINNVLSPHEQRHVRAFRAYNGTVRTPFSLTICRSDLDSSVQAVHDSVEATRRSSAQAASDALDPFSFDVDLDCT